MDKKTNKCVSMGTEITNDKGSVIFDCPGCGKQKIVRSYDARQISAQYVCPECDFVGPN